MPLSGSFTQSFQQLVLDALGQRTVFDPAIDGLKLALFTADPGEGASTSNEISGGGYTRQSVVLGDATNNASNHGEIANTAAISFAASGASWSGITHAGLFKDNSYTRTVMGTSNSTRSAAGTIGGNVIGQRLDIPASHCAVAATLTVTTADAVNANDTHAWFGKLNFSSLASGTYTTTDPLGIINYFIRVKTGKLAGLCFDIKGDQTNALIVASPNIFPPDVLDGEKIDVIAKPTLVQFFGSVPITGNLASGLQAASTQGGSDDLGVIAAESTYNRFWPYSNGTNASNWKSTGNSSINADSCVLFPQELANLYDQVTNGYEDIYIDINTDRSADWTLTSQLSTTDEMLARFQFEDSGGSAQTLNVADGSSLDVAIGDLKLTLN